jgi:hypothetical protein
LTRDCDIGGNLQPGKWAVRGERCQFGRLFPGHRTTDGTAATAQPHRHQSIVLFGQPRTGKTQQQPAVVDPFFGRLGLSGGIGARIGEDQHRKLPF